MGEISHYGVWACIPIVYQAETTKEDSKSPHIYLRFIDDPSSSRLLKAAINVKSTDKDTRLVFWLDNNFIHPVTDQLSKFDLGFHAIQSISSGNVNRKHHRQHSHRHEQKHILNSSLKGLDYIRMAELVDIKSGQVLPHDVPGPNNDILDKLGPILTGAIMKKATAYIFGSSYGSGIHDIHMNQGSLPRYANGIYEDGALLLKFGDGHWEAVFLAFASQRIPTDDQGEALPDSQSLANLLGE